MEEEDVDGLVEQLADELVLEQEQHQRTKRYAATLKKHIKAASAKNMELRSELRLALINAQQLQDELRRLEYEYNTSTNQKLRNTQKTHLDMIEQLQAKVHTQKNELDHVHDRLRSVKARRSQLQTELSSSRTMYTVLKTLAIQWQEKANRSTKAGECVICLTNKARFVVMPCMCLCFCVECRDQHYSLRSCPLCRRNKTHIARVYNLPE